MLGAKYSDIEQSINEKASKINVNITMANPEISVLQEDPWHVALLFSFDLKKSINSTSFFFRACLSHRSMSDLSIRFALKINFICSFLVSFLPSFFSSDTTKVQSMQ